MLGIEALNLLNAGAGVLDQVKDVHLAVRENDAHAESRVAQAPEPPPPITSMSLSALFQSAAERSRFKSGSGEKNYSRRELPAEAAFSDQKSKPAMSRASRRISRMLWLGHPRASRLFSASRSACFAACRRRQNKTGSLRASIRASMYRSWISCSGNDIAPMSHSWA